MKKKLKYAGIIILAIVIVAGGLIYIFRAKIIAHFIPKVEQTGAIDIKVKNDTLYVSSKLLVKNKTFLKIGIDTLKYNVSLFGKTYLHSQKFIGAVLHGHGGDTVGLDIKIPYITILKDIGVERKKSDSAGYSVNLSIQYSTFLGKGEFPVNKSAKLKIPQPPEIEIVAIKYNKIHLKTILAEARISIINHSDFALSIKELKYSMNIIKQGTLQGNYTDSINIKPKETTFISIPIQITPKNLGKTIFEIIINKDNYDYTINLKAILEMTNPFKESFHIELSKDGQMELRK